MYPSQTSLIPVTVSIARFIESGHSLWNGWYPYWYLGSPAKDLLGPLIPYLMVLIREVLPLSLFESAMVLILASFVVSAFAWGGLTYKISVSKRVGFLVGLALLFLPWRFFNAIAISETTFSVARNLLPLVLLAFYQYFSKKTKISFLIAVLSVALLLLINPGILAILGVGILSLILALSFKEGRLRFRIKLLKRAILIFSAGFVLATLWYSPGYWITILANPSIGGASAAKVILRVFDLLKLTLPLLLAILAVYFSKRVKSRLNVFTLTWILTFIILSAFRFLGDIDFWMDWTSWFYEIEIGIAIILAVWLSQPILFGAEKNSLGNILRYLVLLLLPIYATWRIYLAIGRPPLTSSRPPQAVSALTAFSSIPPDSRVFLSGSTVFWANALFDVNQVRGGADATAINPWWDHASYQLREGEDSELAEAWLRAMGVSYVLVHSSKSKEYYKDFVNRSKWQNVGNQIYNQAGDTIIKIDGVSLAWEVDPGKVKVLRPLEDAKDLTGLTNYLTLRKKELNVTINKDRIEITSNSSARGISVSVSYSHRWHATTVEGENLVLTKDILGNILIYTSGQERIILEYK